MNFDGVSIEDCLVAYSLRGWEAVIANGHILGFQKDGAWVDIYTLPHL